MKKHTLILSTVLLITTLAGGCSKTTNTQTPADTTAAVTTEAPATEAPATEAPATEAPVTEVPATQAPATEEATTEVPATEAPATEAPADGTTESKKDTVSTPLNEKQQEGYEIVKQYGLWSSSAESSPVSFAYSELAFELKTPTFKDCGDHYEIDAIFQKVVTVPADMKVGDTVTCTLNELTGETREYKLIDEHTIQEQYEDGDGYEFDYYPQDGENEVALNGWSDDFEWCSFYEGNLYISKEAIAGIEIMNEYHTFSAEDVEGYDDIAWYNGLEFSKEGIVQALVFIGD